MADPEGTELYVVYLGGDLAPGRLGEDHEVVLVVARDLPEARRAARAKWSGLGRAHVDAVRPVTVIDGYRIQLEATTEQETTTIDPTYEPADDAPS
jgi:Domain of Unknown Function (DUF1543)